MFELTLSYKIDKYVPINWIRPTKIAATVGEKLEPASVNMEAA